MRGEGFNRFNRLLSSEFYVVNVFSFDTISKPKTQSLTRGREVIGEQPGMVNANLRVDKIFLGLKIIF